MVLSGHAEPVQFAVFSPDSRRVVTAPYDPDRHGPGVMLNQIVTDTAVGACYTNPTKSGKLARVLYQHGRALTASDEFSAARRDFEEALAHDYRSAGIDLGMLFSQPSGEMLDLPRAISLFEQAWNKNVTIAAFELGSLYEHGVRRPDKDEYLLAPDDTQAWVWYRRGADAGEPNALARLAERDDGAASWEANAAKKGVWFSEASIWELGLKWRSSACTGISVSHSRRMPRTERQHAVVASLRGESSNQLLETLEEWNNYLERYAPLMLQERLP